MNKLAKLIKILGPFSFLLTWVAFFIPSHPKLKKYKNMLLASRSYYKGETILTTLPVNVRIAPTALCNYRCLFCEIHKDNILFPKRSKNEITLQHIHNYEGVLSSAYNLSFFGGSEEPLIAKEFGDITTYMKKTYGTRLMVNTNASLLKGKTLDAICENKFDYIIVSYHAGTEDGYKAIMTGKINKVDENLAALRDKKKELKSKKPVIGFNFALQRLNADEYEAILQKAKDLAADHVIVNRYYGGRNKLQDKKVSYEYVIEEGNAVLDNIYEHAKNINIKLEPKKPDYWVQKAEDVIWEEDNINEDFKCFYPYSDLHFNPVLDRANSHYVGVCNRAELFKIDYNRLNISDPIKAQKLWNHPVLKHLRTSVNNPCDSINPLCKFCKNNQREALRNVDADLYAQKRDEAIEAFFKEFHKDNEAAPIEGLEILDTNPYSDDKFQEKLEDLKKLETAEKKQLDSAIENV